MTPAVTPDTLWAAWGIDPLVAVMLLGGAYAYLRGAERLRDSGRPGAALATRHRWAFAGGVAAVLVALGSPIEALAAELLTAHMVQHLLLVLVAAPLLAASRPHLAVPRGLPGAAEAALARARGRLARARPTAILPVGLVVATGAHVAALWLWHAPPLYGLSLRHDLVHGLEHASFLGTALAVWLPLLRPDRRSRLGRGVGVLCIGALLLLGGVLAALITFAQTPLYAEYARTSAWGLTRLEDQQLAGAIMWVPAGVFYGIVGTVLFARWLDDVERAVSDGQLSTRAPRADAAPR